jgi:hypothetical protein
MSKIFREGMQVPQDPDGGSAGPTKPKKKTKPKKLVLPPLRKGEKEAPSDPDDGSIGIKAGGSPGMHRMPDGRMMKDSEHKKPKKPTKPKKMMGGGMMKYGHGGSVDGIAQRGKTKGRMC